MTLTFDLTAFAKTTDHELLRRVDRRVASYYLAVPLAGEDDRVTVATAYPDNAAALRILERLLHADVVPVASPEIDLQQAIARIYPAAEPAAGAILTWADDPAWDDAVRATAEAFGRAAGHEIVALPAGTSLTEALAAADGGFALLVARVSDEAALARLVHRSPAPLLLVRGDYQPIDHVLVALRGFGSDHETLDRVFPILAGEGAGATVLPLARSGSARLNDLLDGDSPARRHLQTFLCDLDQRNVRVDVRLSQGDPTDQIVTELAGGQHAMLVIAAEAEGRFVWQVVSRIEREKMWPGRPVLIIKPPLRAATLSDSST